MKSLILYLALCGIAAAQLSPTFKHVGSNGEQVNQTPFITALGGTTAGKALFQMADSGAVRYLRINADNTVSQLDAASFLSGIGGGSGSGSFSGLTGQPTDNANLSTTLGLKVATTTLSTTGGANKVLQFDSNGDLQLGPYANGAPGNVTGGNLNIGAWRELGFYDTAGTKGAKMYWWPNHNGAYGELLLDSTGSLCAYFATAFQIGSAVGGNHYVYYHSGQASSGNQKRQAVPSAYYNYTWTGGVNTWNQSVMQVAPLDTSGTNSAFQYFFNTTSFSQDVEGTGNGTKGAEITKDGIWSLGTAPAFTSLTAVSNVFTQTASKYKTVQASKLTLGASSELAISGAAAGMRGVIYVKQDVAGNRLMTLPSGSAKAASFALSTAPNNIDRLTWDYDGSNYFWTITNGITLPTGDSAAIAFLTNSGNSGDATISSAIDNLVIAMKASGSPSLWTKTYRFWPFVGGTSTKHNYELKSASSLGAFSSTGITHNSNGITGDGTNGFMRTGFVPSASSAQNSIGVFVYNRTTLPTDNGAFICGYGTGGIQVGIERSGQYLKKLGLNTNDTSSLRDQSSDFRGLLFANRSASNSEQWGKVGGNEDVGTITSTANCDTQIALLGRYDYGSTYDHPSNANIAAALITQSLDSTERAALKTIIDNFQTALGGGRANP